MVGLHKGHSNGNRSGNKPYGMMLLLAFGVALLGVMTIHKLRERRIFNLLIQEKDHQLISLQLLLQKERDHTKEMKRKGEEMKAKIYSLRNQNMETDRRIVEMQSTIHSLKDERKILESALEEKQADIKMNGKKIAGQEKENLQVTALMESLKQKESEIEDLKRHLEISHKWLSVGTDFDLSNRKLNFSVSGSSVDNGTRSTQSKVETGELYESTNHSNAVNLSESEGSLRANEANNTANATSASVDQFTGETDSGMRSAYGQGHTVAMNELMRLKNSKQDEDRGEGAIKGGLKLEMADSSKTSNARMMEGKYVKEKRWRKLARNRRLVNKRNDENSEAEGIGKRKIPVDNQNQLGGRAEAKTYHNGNTDEQRIMGVTNPLEVKKLEDSKDMKNIPVIEDTVQHVKQLQGNGSLDGEATGTRGNATKESFGSDGVQYESQENRSRYMTMQSNAAHENTIKDERLEENEDTDEDHGADMAMGEFYRELLPDLEEGKEYTKETEEPEF